MDVHSLTQSSLRIPRDLYTNSVQPCESPQSERGLWHQVAAKLCCVRRTLSVSSIREMSLSLTSSHPLLPTPFPSPFPISPFPLSSLCLPLTLLLSAAAKPPTTTSKTGEGGGWIFDLNAVSETVSPLRTGISYGHSHAALESHVWRYSLARTAL